MPAAPVVAAPWIFVCHAPPHDTALDRLPQVPHPIGSRAVRRFIEQRQPLVSLHGHVHESYRHSRSHRGTWGVNVGVDVWDYRPVSEDALAEYLGGLLSNRGD